VLLAQDLSRPVKAVERHCVNFPALSESLRLKEAVGKTTLRKAVNAHEMRVNC
jgi:hypothetical protein